MVSVVLSGVVDVTGIGALGALMGTCLMGIVVACARAVACRVLEEFARLLVL